MPDQPPRDLAALADRAARKYGIPPALFRGLIKNESGWRVDAVSPVGAKGLTQLTDGKVANPFDPAQNLEGGASYLAQQYKRFGRWDYALAAYNAGPGAVEKYGGIPPYAETQRYVHNLMGYLGKGSTTKALKAASRASTPATTAASAPQPLDLSSYAMSVLNDIASGDFSPQHSLGALTGAVAAAPDLGGPAGPVAAPAPHAPAHAPGAKLAIEGDTQHIDAGFLGAVQQAAAAVGGTKIRITSGYRDPAHNRAVGGVPRSNHQYGHAIDGEVFLPDQGWVPIGAALKAVAGKFGLRSGDVPGFYHGGPDPVHVDDGFNQRHK